MPATALTVIHKHIRREMFDFSMRLFRAGAHEIDAVKSAFDELVTLLRAHATQEESRFESLLTEIDPSAAATLLRDHQRLEADLGRVAELVRRLDASSPQCAEALLQIHLDWNRYLSSYLVHLDDEERTLFVALADRMPLSAIAQSAIAQGPEGQKFLDRLWSVTTPTERIAIEHAHAAGSKAKCLETAEVAA